MKKSSYGAVWLYAFLLSSLVHAENFSPDLGMPFELIDGGIIRHVEVPVDAPELTRHPLPLGGTRDLLSAVPGQPFRKVTPPPLFRAWWKYPLYLVLGLPRDAVDTIFGSLAHIPVVSPVVIYPIYEIIPLQAVIRDPRDWHFWPGTRNSLGHGMIDSDGWGWFPSAHSWQFEYVSESKLRDYHEYNEALTKDLNRLNREIELENQRISGSLRQARRIALDAIDRGDGQEALSRMLPYWSHHDLDQGAFALFITSLALYAEDGSGWHRLLLWKELSEAITEKLVRAGIVVNRTHKKFPSREMLGKVLVYIQLLLGKYDDAVHTAEFTRSHRPGHIDDLFMVFETALTARDGSTAGEAWHRARDLTMDDDVRRLGNARLEMINGHPEGMIRIVRDLLADDGENPYLHYFLGIAELERALKGGYHRGAFRTSSNHLEKAALTAPGHALRTRAGKALSYAQTLLDEVSRNPVVLPE